MIINNITKKSLKKHNKKTLKVTKITNKFLYHLAMTINTGASQRRDVVLTLPHRSESKVCCRSRPSLTGAMVELAVVNTG
jgi:hypothetical protein